MNKKIFYFIPMLMLSTVLLAQNSMSEINRIKRDSGYLYGEATLDQKDAAVKLAYEMLEVEIKNWAANKDPKISSVLASQVFNYADTIILHRRNMVRAFAYVKISNLKVVKGKTIAIEVNRDEPLTKPIASNEEVSKPLATAVNTQELKAEEKPQKPSAAGATTATPPAPVQKAVLPKANHSGGNEAEVLAKLKAVKSFYDLEKTIKPLKAQGKISDYGKYSTMSDPANCYLIIYDQDADIRAILGKGTTSRSNLTTGAADSEKNYHGCGAIWFKLKD